MLRREEENSTALKAPGWLAAVTTASIDLTAVLAAVRAPAFGADILFTGVVREHNLGKAVVGIEYDVFAPLAEATFRDILAEARGRWGETFRGAIVHRVGRLEVGEVSVAIAAASVHRDEAYRASRYLIEAVKHRSPIWKKEFYVGGESDWVTGHALCR